MDLNLKVPNQLHCYYGWDIFNLLYRYDLFSKLIDTLHGINTRIPFIYHPVSKEGTRFIDTERYSILSNNQSNTCSLIEKKNYSYIRLSFNYGAVQWLQKDLFFLSKIKNYYVFFFKW